MGYNSVYRVLQDVFPRVDTRLLRAVAIEHSKDADAAVEVVLVEVIPYLSKGTTASGSSSYITVEEAYHHSFTEDTPQVDSTCLDDGTPNGSSYYEANGSHDQECGYNGNEEFVSSGNHKESEVKVGHEMTSHGTSISTIQENSTNDDLNRVHVNTDSGEIISNTDSGEIISNIDSGEIISNADSGEIISLRESSSVKVGSDQASHFTSTTSKHGDISPNGILNGNLLADWEDCYAPSACDCNMGIQGKHREQLCLDGNQLEVENSVVQLDPSLVQECTSDAPEGSLQLKVVQSMLNNDYEKPEPSGTSNSASKKDISASEMVDFEDETALNTVVTRSGQICRIDLLEDIVEDARNNKKTLFSTMESIISLMREVELQERAAEQAKEEAIRGCFAILTRVEDLKQMLRHAKEANDMHAGEVYGEKAILATEVRELQSRLLSLSDERDKSIAILGEMSQTLEERLDAVEKERKAAEQERMEKEESARNALAEQELIMEKVVQESKLLKQEAEENSELREFLMDRGRVVDTLQGEISVICQDVKLLKEKFDERVPLSKSLSSSQTSCILASSNSSLNSMAPDVVPEQAESSETPKKTTPTPSVDVQLSSGEERTGDDRKALVDDGWEFFDNREFYM